MTYLALGIAIGALPWAVALLVFWWTRPRPDAIPMEEDPALLRESGLL